MPDDPDPHGHLADNPAQIPLPGWREIARRVVRELKEDRVAMMAAAVAFAGLVAIFPALIGAMSLFGLLVDPLEAARLTGELTGTLPTDAAVLLRDQIQELATAEDSALGGSFVIAVVPAVIEQFGLGVVGRIWAMAARGVVLALLIVIGLAVLYRDTTTGPPEPIGQRGANPADTLPDDVSASARGR